MRGKYYMMLKELNLKSLTGLPPGFLELMILKKNVKLSIKIHNYLQVINKFIEFLLKSTFSVNQELANFYILKF